MTTQEEIAELETQLTATADLREQAQLILKILRKLINLDSKKTEPYTERLLQIAEKLNSDEYKAWACLHRSNSRGNAGEYAIAFEEINRALSLFASISHKEGMANCHSVIGNFYRRQSNFSESLANHLAALKIGQEIGNKNSIAGSYLNIAHIYEVQGKISAALTNYVAGLEMFEEIGNKHGMAAAYQNIGGAHFNLGNYTEALNSYLSSLQMFTELDNKHGIAASYSNIGNIYMDRGDYSRGLSSFVAALKIAEETGIKHLIASSHNNLGIIYDQLGDHNEALSNYFSSLKIINQGGDLSLLAQSYLGIGDIYCKQGNFTETLTNYEAALKINNEIGYKLGSALSYASLGSLYYRQSNYAEALSNHFKALRIAGETGQKQLIGRTKINIGKSQTALKEYEQAAINLTDGLKMTQELGLKEEIKEALKAWYDLKKAEGDMASALAYYERFVVVENELQNEKTNKKIATIQFGHQMEKKEQEVLFERRKKAELEVAYNLLEEKNAEIMQSINYALRLQRAILPPPRVIKQYVSNSFLLYLPKDIVAGDFYWLEPVNDLILFAACDCTGHGVPGAMVSVICHNALNRAVREFGLTRPAAILDKATELVVENFSAGDGDIPDGMDASLCVLDQEKRTLQWAGAHNPLWLIRNGELLETRGDKQPVGKSDYGQPFTNHHLELRRGDGIYIFTDGFADQFGGADNKKLGRKRFKELLLQLQNLPFPEQGKELEKFINGYRQGQDQIDDILVMGVKM